MNISINIAFELEKTFHLSKSKVLEIFRENNFPVSKDQWVILERISQNQGSNQKDIAHDTFKDPAALTRMLDVLVKKGYVKRQPSAIDRRTFDIYLTVEGNRLINRLNPILDLQKTAVENSLSPDDKNSLIALLQKLQISLL